MADNKVPPKATTSKSSTASSSAKSTPTKTSTVATSRTASGKVATPTASSAKTATARTAPTAKTTTAASSSTKPTAAPTAKTANARTTVAPSKSATPTAAKPTATPNKTSTVATSRSANGKVATPTAATKTATARTATAQSSAAKPATSTTATGKASAPATSNSKAASTSASKEAAATSAATAGSVGKSSGTAKAAAMTSAEKSKKQSSSKSTKSSAKKSGGGSATATKDNKLMAIIIAVVCFVLIIALVFGLVFGIRGCNSKKNAGLTNQDAFAINSYPAVTRVAYHAEETNNVSRYKPVEGVKDERDAFGVTSGYPKYGSTLKAVIGADEAKVKARQALINESAYLAAYGTRGANNDGKPNDGDKYTWMDKDGYLYRGSVSAPVKAVEIKGFGASGEKIYSDNQRQLYKHTASVGLYLGNVADDEPAITKKITLSPRGYTSYSVTGVYAPAGEVLTVRLSGAAMKATGGIAINIGQALYNSQANNIWAGKNAMNRMPHVLTTLVLNANTMTYNEETDTWTGYIGSFLGGPVYVQNESSTFELEISGGVTYKHFILGYTTPEEFERNAKSTAPYFDLEVWEYGVLHSGPKNYVKNFSYSDLYDAAIYWEKVSLVTTQRGNGYKQGIVFIYDSFVAAGAAVAFPGRSSVNCPLGWMTSSLNYKAMVTSGSWGNMHEYHHNFQGFGVGGGADGEVTNNSLTLVSYALFTNISAKRGIGNYGAAALGGWNNYTVGTWTLNQINNNSIGSTNGLAVYATLLHNFGPNAYIKNAKGSNKGYWDNWSNFTGYDMSYYANLVSKYAIGEKPAANPNKPMFIPVSCVYQTGRSYGTGDNKKYFTSTRPYVIPYGNEFNIDLSLYTAPSGQYASGSIVLPTNQDANQTARFDYAVKSVSQPEHGKIEKIDEYRYKFIPDSNLESGKIIVTLEITDKTGAITNIDDVDLVLEFTQSHEMNKMTLERTTYTYAADKMYTDAVEAYNANFGGYTTVETQNQSNPTQNANTDIWFYPDTEKMHTDHPNAPDKYFIHENQIEVVDGKLLFGEDGKYRVYLRGRTNCALYFSLDGRDYKLGATIKSATSPDAPKGWASAQFRLFDSNTYFDVEFDEGAVTVTVFVGGEATYNYTLSRGSDGDYKNWLYIKEVLIDQTLNGVVSYIGVGFGQWSQTMFSVSETYHKADGGQLQSAEDEGYSYTQNTYTNYAGATVAATRSYSNGSTKYYKITGGKYEEITSAQLADLTEPKLVAPTSAAYSNAYRRTYESINQGFASDYFYTRGYAANYIDNVNMTPAGSVTLLNCNYKAYSGFSINNLTDGKSNTYFHTNNTVNASRPLILTFDMGEEKTSNRISIVSRNHNNMGEGPGSFKLEGSNDGVAFFDVGEFSNLPFKNTTTVDFDEASFRYFRVTITQAQPQASGKKSDWYIVISSITLIYSTEVTGGALYSPDNAMFTYNGNWSMATVHSNFGHVFVGQKGATIDFEFEGTQLGIVSSNKLGQNYEVYIDGKRVDSMRVKEDPTATYRYTYVSTVLDSGKHKVQIKCTGEANFDSFGVFNKPIAA